MKSMGWLIGLGITLLILALLLFVPLKIEVFIRKNDREDWLILYLRIGSWQLPFLKINSVFNNWTMLVNYYWQNLLRDSSFPPPALAKKFKAGLPSFVTRFMASPVMLKKADLRHLEWSTRVGLANPAVTGIVAGSLWHLKHRFYRYLAEATAGVFALPLFTVVPDFNETRLELEFRCIFGVRGGHIISAAGQLCWSLLCSFLRGDKIEQPSH
jgi:hypothetical protein